MVKKFLLLILVVVSGLISNAQQLILPGDYPDPSVVKIGDTYWATATTSNWAPVYPLLKSKDLINWTQEGHVFETKPGWADYYFWAPEISYENGKVYIYYSAHKKDGNLCIGIASADKPEGPYTDHGPLICQPAGSIDAFVTRDENNTLYMIWKEDGNSVGQPTPMWAQQLNEERTKLLGEKVELFRNDAPWEANLVEGAAVIRHNEYFYMFYAAAGCCGPKCSYANGVARSKTLLGPWEKYDKNPILADTDQWKCPGHGTPVEMDGRYYFMYHAYNTESNVYAGRQGLIQEFRFTDDGWIEFISDPSAASIAAAPDYYDDFNGNSLHQSWQYSIFQKPDYSVSNGNLELKAGAEPERSFLGQKTYTTNYSATVSFVPGTSTASGGIALIGDENNLLALVAGKSGLSIVNRKDGTDNIEDAGKIPPGKNIYLRLLVTDGHKVVFQYSTDNKKFISVNRTPLSAIQLPPWDRALRTGIINTGKSGKAVFSSFTLDSR